MTSDPTLVHATTVSINGQGVLILGPSGAGKSALALQLIALGAVLVADDQTRLTCQRGKVIADAPPAIAGMIEARGLGIINLPHEGPTPVSLVVDMGQVERKRLPDPHQHQIAGQMLPCLHKVEGPHFPGAITLYIKGTPET